jgi:hypothetical protein
VLEAIRLIETPGLLDKPTRPGLAEVLASKRIYLLPQATRFVRDADERVVATAWEAIRKTAPEYLALASEAELISLIKGAAEPRDLKWTRSYDFFPCVEPLAAELARRGPRGAAALRPIVEAEAKAFDPKATSGRTPLGPLCLAALRRAQGDPPPLVLEIPDSPLTFMRNGAVRMRVELVNREREFPNLVWLIQDPKFELGASTHFQVDCTPVDNTPHRAAKGSRAYVVSASKHLDIPPAHAAIAHLDLIQYTPLSRPGAYEVAVTFDPVFQISTAETSRVTTTNAVTRRITLPEIGIETGGRNQ